MVVYLKNWLSWFQTQMENIWLGRDLTSHLRNTIIRQSTCWATKPTNLFKPSLISFKLRVDEKFYPRWQFLDSTVFELYSNLSTHILLFKYVLNDIECSKYFWKKHIYIYIYSDMLSLVCLLHAHCHYDLKMTFIIIYFICLINWPAL